MVLYSGMRTAPLNTSCWFGLIPDDYVRIGISPGGLATGHRLYRKLNPGERFNSSRPAEYIKRYNAEILFKLNAQKVLQDLVRIASGKAPVLCCFERVGSGQWCHRASACRKLVRGGAGHRRPGVRPRRAAAGTHPLLLRSGGRPRDRLARHLSPSETTLVDQTSISPY